MKRVFLIASCVLALAACQTAPATGPIASLPGASTVCPVIKSDAFDTVLRAYDVATDAINLLIDTKVIKPGSVTAVKIADANDRILAAFAVAEHARAVCDSTGYLAAIANAQAAIADLRLALHK